MPDLSLSGKLPAGERNGLPSVLPDLLKDNHTPRLAFVLLNVSKVTKDADTGDEVPTLRILGIEPVTESDDARIVERLIRRAVERRTGKVELPFELEEALDELGVEVDSEAEGE
jgi:hypothetical protein